MQLEDHCNAEANCGEGLQLVREYGSSLMHGRLCRLMGQIRMNEGKSAEANDYFKIALECFTSAQASKEVQETLQLIIENSDRHAALF